VVAERDNTDSTQPAGVVTKVRGVSFQGPLPPPEILKQYDMIIPGLAERIVSMAEREQRHVHELRHQQLQFEKSAHTLQMQYFGRGQWFAFILAIIFGSISALLALRGHEVAASSIGGTTILGIVAAYIAGYWKPASRKEENPDDSSP
jgi:uncharacterized membrane protein